MLFGNFFFTVVLDVVEQTMHTRLHVQQQIDDKRRVAPRARATRGEHCSGGVRARLVRRGMARRDVLPRAGE